MAIETGLEGKPWYVAGVVALFLGAGVVAAVHWFWLKDMTQQMATKETTLTGLQQQINAGRAARARKPQFEEEVARLEVDLEKLLKVLPARRNTEELLVRIRRLTEQGDFDLMRFSPKTPQRVDFYSEWPITIQVQGTYHNLALFFDKMGRFSRIMNVDSLNISSLVVRGGSSSYHSIRADFTAKTFLYHEPEPEPETEL